MADRQVEEDLMELLRKGSIKVEIEKIYPMEDALDVRLFSQRLTYC